MHGEVEMEVGTHLVRIVQYGINQSKAGGFFVFIDVEKDGTRLRWYGSPIKKDGTANDMCLSQLVACGFDPEKDFDLLSEGPTSGLLIMDEDIECYIASEMAGDGSMAPKIKWLGIDPLPRLSSEEIKTLISEDQKVAIKAAASKFKVKKRTARLDPEEDVAF